MVVNRVVPLIILTLFEMVFGTYTYPFDGLYAIKKGPVPTVRFTTKEVPLIILTLFES